MKTIAKPFGVLLMWLYEFIGNYGVAVILFALLVKIVLLPFMMKSKRGSMKMIRLQPQLKELETRHGANRQKYNEEVQKLYQREKINPMSGCIWTLIPFPILIALYYAIRCPLTTMMGIPADLLSEGGRIFAKLSSLGFDAGSVKAAYLEIGQASFISNHFEAFAGISDKLRQIDYSFLGMDLGAQPQWNFLFKTNWSDPSVWLPGLGLFLIPLVAALLTYLSSLAARKMNPSSAMEQQGAMLNIFMPLMTLSFAFVMPAALGLYWIASSFFGIIQDIWMTMHYKKIMDIEDAERIEEQRKKDEELAKKRAATERLKAENATVANPNTSKRKQQIQQRQEQAEKAMEWDRKTNPKTDEVSPSQVGSRRYARGRAYDPDRFNPDRKSSAVSEEPSEVPEEPAEETPVIPANAVSDEVNTDAEEINEFDDSADFEDDDSEDAE